MGVVGFGVVGMDLLRRLAALRFVPRGLGRLAHVGGRRLEAVGFIRAIRRDELGAGFDGRERLRLGGELVSFGRPEVERGLVG